MNRREMLLASLGLAVAPSVAVRAEECPRLVCTQKLSPELMAAMRAVIEAQKKSVAITISNELSLEAVSAKLEGVRMMKFERV